MAFNTVFEAILKQLNELHGAKVTVGVQGEPGKNSTGQTVSSNSDLQKIAYVHEFGYDIEVTEKMRAWLHYNGIHLKPETKMIHIPERSYIRRAYAEGAADYRQVFNKLIGQLMRSEITVDELLDNLGKQCLNDTYSNIGEGTKPVSQYTLNHRKSNDNPSPLIDTGNLRDYITYRIEKKGSQV